MRTSFFFSVLLAASMLACGGDDDGETLTNGGGGDSPGGDGDGGAAGPVNGCATFEDKTAESAITITWSLSLAGQPGACLKVKKGTTVTWSGDLTEHPLSASGGTTPNPISVGATTGGIVTFGKPGTYGYVCTKHPTMTGAIEVSE